MKKKIAAIYARVSSQRQKKEETIKSQVDSLLKLSKENDYEIPSDLVFKDEGYSGETLDRPALDKLRDLARENILEAIFIHKPDRLARKFVKQLILEEEFGKFGVKVIYFQGAPQASTPDEQMLVHFQGIFAEYERTQILERSRRGKLYRVRQGDFRMLPSAPYGYNNERGEFFYTIREDQAQAVREIFRLFIWDRLNLRQVCQHLEKKGILAPRGGLHWDPTTIKGILENSAYTGTAYFGKTERYEGSVNRIVRYKDRGRVLKPIKAKKWRSKELWEPLKVPQIICESDFEKVQAILKRNKELASRNTKEPSILQGLLTCGLCGKSYYKKRRIRKEINQTYYTCHSHLLGTLSPCGNKSLRQEVLDKLVWERIIELLNNPMLIEQEIIRRCNDDAEMTRMNIRKVDLQRELKQIQKASDKLLDAYQEGNCLSLPDLKTRMGHLKARERSLKKEEESLEAQIIRKEKIQDIRFTLEMFKTKLANSFENLSTNDKQKVVRTLIDEIVIFPEEVEVKHIIPISESGKCSPLYGVGRGKPWCDERIEEPTVNIPQIIKPRQWRHFIYKIPNKSYYTPQGNGNGNGNGPSGRFCRSGSA